MYLTVGEFVNLQLNSMYQLAMNHFRNKQTKSLSIVIYHKQVEHEVDIYLIMCNLTYIKIEINDNKSLVVVVDVVLMLTMVMIIVVTTMTTTTMMRRRRQ